MFKKPQIPKIRKQEIIPDGNNFFYDFLKESSEENSQTDSELGLNTVKDTNDMLSFDEPKGISVKCKRKCKQPAMDFERFFRETLKSCNDSSAVIQVSPTEEDNDSMQFDLNFTDNNGLSDFFADQKKSEKDDYVLSLNLSD